MRRPASRTWLIGISVLWVLTVVLAVARPMYGKQVETGKRATTGDIHANASDKITRGQQAFRFDTFGSEAFWGNTLGLHQAIEGLALGGVGPGVSPRTALAVGLKIDIDALPGNVVAQIRRGAINLDDPALTVALLQLNAVVGLTGFFSGNTLQSVGIQCALCHSTVDDSGPSQCFGTITPNPGTGCIGHRLDGWANRDLNVGAIVALAPNLQPFADLLGTSQATVRTVLNSWGPGKFDAELILDGKAFNPIQITDGLVTGTNVPGATLIPPAFGLGGVNLHTWTGWGSVSHWNAFVANLEMHGVGRFWDPRLDSEAQFPIAAAHSFGDLPHISPDDDRITPKLSDLQFYQLAIPSPQPRRAASITPQRIADTSCFAAKRNVTTATSSHSGPIPAGICIRPQKFVSTLFKRTAHRICDIARRRLVRCSHVSKAVFIMTVAFRHWTGWSITTTPA